MLRRLSELFSSKHQPAGYRPGVTLGHVQRNLSGLGFEALDSRRGRFSAADGSLHFEVHERTQSELLMHLVVCEFILQVPSSGSGQVRLEVHHTGAMKRAGIGAKCRSGACEDLAYGVLHDDALREALMPLDFKRLSIERQDHQWRVTLEHMAASEVVNRMPSFRRYIRLDERQQAALFACFKHLQRILINY
ncbi:DUF3156 domain-containing protein [Pseudomonas hunanensis]|uniref:DUF3156 domain-containing protein n=1 Tax=Pseudomonas hunanensis TaxID=1247546 RepID=A0ABD6N0P7_9PSED|nr:DUF3156 family protein [Pseudomonas hunanensis]NWL47418.1 DUF3156 domain-containing protein [Pseudomonas hunanensis]